MNFKMTKVKELKQFKVERKAKLIAKELEEVNHIIDLSLKALNKHSKYRGVLEILSVLKTNKDLFQIHLDKYKKILDNKKND